MATIKSQACAVTKGCSKAATIRAMSDETPRESPAPARGGEPAGTRCLSAEQLLALSAVAAGPLPDDVAAHLASCERCQRRALFGAPDAAAGRARERPSLGRAFLRVGIVLVALAMVLVSFLILLG